MKTEKEIIDEIVNRLKSRPEIEYRQGAWESFKDQHSINGTKIRHIPRWAATAAAAAVLLLGIGTLYYINDSVVSPDVAPVMVSSENKSSVVQDSHSLGNNEGRLKPTTTDKSFFELKQDLSSSADKIVTTQMKPSRNDLIASYSDFPRIASAKVIESRQVDITMDDIAPFNEDIRQYSSIGTNVIQSNTITAEQLALSATAIPTSEVRVREVENISQNKNVRFGDKFDLGLYVSPQSTGDKMNVGGGLTLAYNLSSKISVRTGASYNSYEVGALKNPNAPDSYESVLVSNEMNKNMLNSPSSQTSKMMIPNVNAVTSIVQSVDVPLEVKYNVGKSFYAVAGVSYSAIIGQERNAHYIDNVNAETFSAGLPESEKQVQTAVKAVTKTVKSAEKSVATNGFNGFVNFSVGKKVKVNNKFGVSVEPYFKIPVGEYRRADMDFTNGGIRIMTNF